MGKIYLFFLSITSFVLRKSRSVLVNSISSLSKTTQRNTYGRNKTSILVQVLDKTDVCSLNTKRRFVFFLIRFIYSSQASLQTHRGESHLDQRAKDFDAALQNGTTNPSLRITCLRFLVVRCRSKK